MTALLVSVRNAAEAEEALAGGADIIDVKEPSRGPLGCANPSAVEGVITTIGDRRRLSAALGELRDVGNLIALPRWLPHASYLKVGLSRCEAFGPGAGWHSVLGRFARRVSFRTKGGLVAVAYADHTLAGAPPPYDVMRFAIDHRLPAFLIDTWTKDGRTLLDWLSVADLEQWCGRCRAAAIPVALAGSLGSEQIRELLPVAPDLFAVRGAACVGGRNGTVSRERVAELVSLLSSPC
jgi:uncharacterized protein (UPF0264 family)